MLVNLKDLRPTFVEINVQCGLVISLSCVPVIFFIATTDFISPRIGIPNLSFLSYSLQCLFSFPDDCISIPCKYTSHLSPLMSHKLYNEVRLCKERDKNPEVSNVITPPSSQRELCNIMIYCSQRMDRSPLNAMSSW